MNDVHWVSHDTHELLCEEFLALAVDGMVSLGEEESVLFACFKLAESAQPKRSIKGIMTVGVGSNEYISDLFNQLAKQVVACTLEGLNGNMIAPFTKINLAIEENSLVHTLQLLVSGHISGEK